MSIYPGSKHKIRLVAAFFLLGVINNVLYVIILSAALDQVGADTPKAVVLLANILPSVLVKLTAPYLFIYIPHTARVSGVVVLNFVGMLLVSTGQQTALWLKLFGIALASCASGAGEITFLQISHSYPSVSLAAWSSGTGGAGILGGVLYLASTTWLRYSPQQTLLASSMLPIIMAASYFVLLPAPEVKYAAVPQEESSSVSSFRNRVSKVRPLLLPFMLPLFLVYFAEYTINQGLTPTLLFPISETPFRHYRDIYPTYATIYQVGVFISRSSSPFFRIRSSRGLYIVSCTQCGLLVLMLFQALFTLMPIIYMLFVIILVEGIFGGLVYVNAFHNVSESKTIAEEDKEFSIGSVGLADSLGVLVAACTSLWLEPTVCRYQVAHGRPFCTME